MKKYLIIEYVCTDCGTPVVLVEGCGTLCLVLWFFGVDCDTFMFIRFVLRCTLII